MDSLFFVTSNSGKFEEVQRWLSELDSSIRLIQAPIDLLEYQSLDIHFVAKGKSAQAWALLERPLLIDDGGIYLKHYNQFPGTLAKYVYQGLGLEGFWKLAVDDPRAYFLSCIVYKEEQNTHHFFEGICDGVMVKPDPATVAHATLPFTKMFIPEGSTKTLAALRGTEEEKSLHHRYKALKKFVEWLKTRERPVS
jgi:XTP/dITP diphosphohydrolase